MFVIVTQMNTFQTISTPLALCTLVNLYASPSYSLFPQPINVCSGSETSPLQLIRPTRDTWSPTLRLTSTSFPPIMWVVLVVVRWSSDSHLTTLPLQVFVLMQFDPGMEYQPGWGDGESQLLFVNCIKTLTLTIIWSLWQHLGSFMKWVNLPEVGLPHTTSFDKKNIFGTFCRAQSSGWKFTLKIFFPGTFGERIQRNTTASTGGANKPSESKSWLLLCSANTDGPYSYI